MYNIKKQFVQIESDDTCLSILSQSEENQSEQILYEGTPFFIIYYILELISPISNKVVYDLGSGYGRFVLAGALKYRDTQFKGIELINERVIKANYFLEKLNIKNAVFMKANALNIDISDGDIFFLFNPFSTETLIHMIDKFKSISQRKNISILAIGIINEILLKQDWLELEVDRGFRYKGVDLWHTCLYHSI